MAIIVSKNGNNAQKLDETSFGLENQLQEYVKNNPDIIPIYEIQQDARLLILAREFGTNSGPIDALGVDQDGNIYVIETKLYKNPDKRIVLAQALDYGASLWLHSGEAADFVEILNQRVLAQFGVGLVEKLQDFFEVDDTQFIVDTMAKNVVSGNIKFVILMDKAADRLKDLITYVNQNSRFDIYAVDLEYYRHDEFEIIIPKLYGSEVKKAVTTHDDSMRFDNQKIINWINEIKPDYLTISQDNTTKTFIRFTTKYLDELMPPRDDNLSGWKNGTAYYYEIRTDRSGWVKMQLALNASSVSKEQAEGQRKIIQFVEKQPKKNEWTWFVAASWKVDYQNGGSTLRNDIQCILTKKIPEFESNLMAFARAVERQAEHQNGSTVTTERNPARDN